jgi:transposase-like protein
MKKPRRSFSPTEKAAVVRRHLVDKVPVSSLADELSVQPSQIHLWVKQVLDQAETAFLRSTNSRQVRRAEDAKAQQIVRLEEELAKTHQKLAKKNEVVAELMEEHVQLKKELGEL